MLIRGLDGARDRSREELTEFDYKSRSVVSGRLFAKVTINFVLGVVDIPAFCIKRWDWLHMPKSGCCIITNRVLLSFTSCLATSLFTTPYRNRPRPQHHWIRRIVVTAMQHSST